MVTLLKYYLFLSFLMIGMIPGYSAEKKDSVPADTARMNYPNPYHWNVIKFNPTPMLLLSNVNNLTFSYERLVKYNQSVCLQVGYLVFPRIFVDTLIGIDSVFGINMKGGKKQGINLAVDYRFYPMKRNRRPAPDGLFLGGYASYYGFKFKNPFDILYTQADQNAELRGSINILNVGMELGYQFIFWKRLSVDLIMFGPSISFYSREFQVSGSLDESQISHLDEELVQKLIEKFPLVRELFTTDDLKFTGTRTNLSIGFRYSLSIGFHF